jgi:hypothetical protein
MMMQQAQYQAAMQAQQLQAQQMGFQQDPYGAPQQAFNQHNPGAPAESVSAAAVNTQAPVAGMRVGEASGAPPPLNDKTIAIGERRLRTPADAS